MSKETLRIQCCESESEWGIRRKEPILAIIYNGGGDAHAIEISYGFGLDQRLVKLVPVNYFFLYQK